MYVSECRAEAYHVEIGVTFGEETTFQAGVYAEYARFFAEEFAVGVDRNLHQLAIGIHLPCRISIGRNHFGTGEFVGGAYSIAPVVKIAHDIGAL